MKLNKFITCLADIPVNQSCVVFGAGNAGQNLYQLIERYREDIVVDFFIDSYNYGELYDIKIISPDTFFDNTDNALILIATESWYEVEQLILHNNYDKYMKVPLNFLFNSGKESISKQINIISAINNTLFNLYYTGTEDQEIKVKLKQVEELLAYDEDKILYRLLTCQNMTQSECVKKIVDFYFNHKPTRQYLDFINFSAISTIIDGGVFDGKETADFIDAFGKNISIFGFEPNKAILFKSPYFKKINSSHFIHIEKGLWSCNSVYYFNQYGASSYISSKPGNNSIKIEVSSIDEYVTENKLNNIDFIKLDIEGAEMEALKGAANTILTHRPQLAICIYHKQSDFYEIPLYIDSLLSNYSYRLNHYRAGSYESVWYAIPDELQS